MNEEADLKLIMGWIGTKEAKGTLLAVLVVVLAWKYSAHLINFF
jgi:hypothetical protein